MGAMLEIKLPDGMPDWTGHYGLRIGLAGEDDEACSWWADYDPIVKVYSGQFCQVYFIVDEDKFNNAIPQLQSWLDVHGKSGSTISIIEKSERDEIMSAIATAHSSYRTDHPA